MTGPTPTPADTAKPVIEAYVVGDSAGWSIEPASPRRGWMDNIPHGFAYRCLPLVIGNQAGWVIRCPAAFNAVWNGSTDIHAVTVLLDPGSERYKPMITSHFGHGILTFSLPWLFRTSPGYGLLIRGPTNMFKHNATPLDAFVETDWSPFTFTMNWKLHRPNQTVRFERGEICCQILPYSLDAAESFGVSFASIDSNPELKAGFEAWKESRNAFNARSDRTAQEWQKVYVKGQAPVGESPIAHRTNLKLAKFPTNPQ
ncbi:MAG TPA: DUF6065 family protein [Phycisphaerales bacterium]|nr:DUF6065 family protein [Phycisphaerales bacterium]